MMQRTRVSVISILMIFGALAAVEAKGTGFAIGGEGALYIAGSGGLPMSAMLVFHVPQVPLMFAIGVSTPLAVAVTVDYWAAHGSLGSIFDWYVGVGAYLAVEMGSGGTISAGGRLPIGLQAWPIGQSLEIFAEIAPAVGVVLVPTGFDWHLQAAVGLRFWL